VFQRFGGAVLLTRFRVQIHFLLSLDDTRDPTPWQIVRLGAKFLREHSSRDVQKLPIFDNHQSEVCGRDMHIGTPSASKHDKLGFHGNALLQLLGHPCHGIPQGHPFSICFCDNAVFFSASRFPVK
jgi:hypothetical protein